MSLDPDTIDELRQYAAEMRNKLHDLRGLEMAVTQLQAMCTGAEIGQFTIRAAPVDAAHGSSNIFHGTTNRPVSVAGAAAARFLDAVRADITAELYPLFRNILEKHLNLAIAERDAELLALNGNSKSPAPSARQLRKVEVRARAEATDD